MLLNYSTKFIIDQSKILREVKEKKKRNGYYFVERTSERKKKKTIKKINQNQCSKQLYHHELFR